jgi:hypothetical protein
VSQHVLPFVDVERLVIAHGKAVGYTYKLATDRPIPLDPALPLTQVTATAGSADGEVTASPRVDLSCFALTRDALWAQTAAATELMRSLSGAEVAGQLVDTVRTVMRPYYLAWSPTVHRTISTYEIQLRPRTT